MTRLWDNLSEQSKRALTESARVTDPFWEAPKHETKKEIETDCLETTEQIAKIMTQKPASPSELREDKDEL